VDAAVHRAMPGAAFVGGMTGSRSTRRLEGRVYRVLVDDSGDAALELADVDLGPVAIIDGELHGSGVVVACRGVLVADTAENGLVGHPMDEIVATDDRLAFEPRRGGVRTRENRLARGVDNAEVADALSFGMVNAFYHTSRGIERLASWLHELEAGPLPTLKILVGAHSGSRLPGFGIGDGDYRSGRMRPRTGPPFPTVRRAGLVSPQRRPQPDDDLPRAGTSPLSPHR
jgi:hypothetical protein